MAKKDTDDIVKQAHDFYKLMEDREAENYRLWIEDVKFANGNSDNNWQWSEQERRDREAAKKPVLTVNKIKQHNRQIINDGRQNKMEIVVKPAHGGATKETADIIERVIRRIQRRSDAQTAYNIAEEFSVEGGLGYFTLETDYVDDESLSQEILIKPKRNPLTVYMDGDEFDGSDAMNAIEIEDYPKSVFKQKWPGVDAISVDFAADKSSKWETEDKIRVAKYWKVTESNIMLYFDQNGDVVKDDGTNDELIAYLKADPNTKKRKSKKRKVKYYIIAGHKKIDEYEWAGSYIPIIRMVGDEKIIDGEVIRSGNTRDMKSSQRIYNYELSTNQEFKKIQSKIPWLVALEAIPEPFAKYWETADDVNHAYLPWLHRDSDGNPIPAPSRIQPPMPSQAYLEGMRSASEDMQAVTGQFDAAMGNNVNEQSGVAVQKIQNRNQTNTFHYEDNKARALKFAGVQLVELIPLVIDVKTIVKMLGEDDKEEEAVLDPNQPQSYTEQQDPMTGKVQKIFNPGVGKYEVDVQVGQAYGTRRQEGFAAMSEIAARNPEFMNRAGDIYWEAADFPMADKIAERYAPPGGQDGKPVDPMVAQLQQQLQAVQGALADKSAEEEKIRIEKEKVEVDKYNAETNRLKEMALGLTPEQRAAIAYQLMRDMSMNQMNQPEQPMQQQAPMMPQQPIGPAG